MIILFYFIIQHYHFIKRFVILSSISIYYVLFYYKRFYYIAFYQVRYYVIIYICIYVNILASYMDTAHVQENHTTLKPAEKLLLKGYL